MAYYSHLTSASSMVATALLMVAFASAVVGTLDAPKHLHFYMHESYTGPKPSAAVIVNGTGQPLKGSRSSGRFGDMVVMDDPLTEGPTPSSRAVGRAQGFYFTANRQGDPAVLLAMTVLLAGGPYNGSSLAVMGRNDAVVAPERELAVVGGTGVIRMATGYVLLKTASWRGKVAVLQLDAFVYVSPVAAAAAGAGA